MEVRDPPRLAGPCDDAPCGVGEKPGNTRRSAVRSSGGHASAIASMSGTGTVTHRRAARGLALADAEAAPARSTSRHSRSHSSPTRMPVPSSMRTGVASAAPRARQSRPPARRSAARRSSSRPSGASRAGHGRDSARPRRSRAPAGAWRGRSPARMVSGRRAPRSIAAGLACRGFWPISPRGGLLDPVSSEMSLVRGRRPLARNFLASKTSASG